jgi:fructose-bisphosphate aldolase class II
VHSPYVKRCSPLRLHLQPGNVKLSPEILDNSQKFIKEKLATEDSLPVFFVFHGGSGSEKDKIEAALTYGVIKMNIDTDTQWAYWDGVRMYDASKHDYLQVGQECMDIMVVWLCI